MAGRHRTMPGRHRQFRAPSRPRLVEVLDARTRTAHLLTPDAYAAGFAVHVPYVAVCGEPVLPAEPHRARGRVLHEVPHLGSRPEIGGCVMRLRDPGLRIVLVIVFALGVMLAAALGLVSLDSGPGELLYPLHELLYELLYGGVSR
jgi:hypothetical protein